MDTKGFDTQTFVIFFHLPPLRIFWALNAESAPYVPLQLQLLAATRNIPSVSTSPVTDTVSPTSPSLVYTDSISLQGDELFLRSLSLFTSCSGRKGVFIHFLNSCQTFNWFYLEVVVYRALSLKTHFVYKLQKYFL